MGSRRRRAALATAAAVGLTLGFAGVAHAVSGGGVNPSQQDCTPNADAWSAPAGTIQPGCHNLAVNVESGGTTDGNPDAGNTRYAEVGLDQLPDGNSSGTPTPYSFGWPGQDNSPHSGCVAANTAGTGGGTGTGCGDNQAGTGLQAGWNYYELYCLIMEKAGVPPTRDPAAPVFQQLSDQTHGFVSDGGLVVGGCGPQATGTATNHVTPATNAPDPAALAQSIEQNGLLVYFGMDDNSDAGEHDGVSGTEGTVGAINGPSDGGGVTLSVTPQSAARGNSLSQPEGLANASVGFCADGICGEGTTQRQTVYRGCGANPAVPCQKGTPSQGNVYDYTQNPSPQEPATCNSGDAASQSPKNCGGKTLDDYRSQTPSSMNAQPGVQLYSDPDPQRSPAAPTPLWPTPAAYAGTCGVYAGSAPTTGQVSGVDGTTPGTNSAGQVAVPTGC